MFEVSVEGCFSAAHALSIGGVREPVHGHDWRVTVTLQGPALDADGLLCDFHAVEAALRELTGLLNNRDLNALAPFCDGVNPSAENVAKVIADGVWARLDPEVKARVTLASVRVTEAPGCAATYLPRLGKRAE